MGKTIEKYISAANAGLCEAQYRLGLFYQTGTGVNKDIVRAAGCIRKPTCKDIPKPKGDWMIALPKCH